VKTIKSEGTFVSRGQLVISGTVVGFKLTEEECAKFQAVRPMFHYIAKHTPGTQGELDAMAALKTITMALRTSRQKRRTEVTS
jgi:hypothetical protein